MSYSFSLKEFQGRADLHGHVHKYSISFQELLMLLDVLVQ